jgi:Rieske Fe-S protein
MTLQPLPVARRTALLGAGVVVGTVAMVGCAGNADKSDSAGGEPGPLARTSDVPVGSALIVDGIVLTQPKAGEFTGLSAVCPHAGCAVSEVDGAQVICGCHGSTFGLDGAVITGPSTKALAAAAITVRGDSIFAG